VCECVLAPGHVGELQAPLYWFAACVFDSRISSLSTAIIIGSDSRAPSPLTTYTYATRSAATPATCLCYYYCTLLLSLSLSLQVRLGVFVCGVTLLHRRHCLEQLCGFVRAVQPRKIRAQRDVIIDDNRLPSGGAHTQNWQFRG
jgi:hypothetical protein